MQALIQSILRQYPQARANSRFSGEHDVYQLFGKLRDKIADLDCIKNNQTLSVRFSCGQGNWAAIPWLAILDNRETTSTQRGTYAVLLFGEKGEG